MKYFFAVIAVIIVLVFSFIFSPVLAKNPELYPNIYILWIITLFLFLIIGTSLLSLFYAFIQCSFPRALLNLLISLAVVTYLLPVFFNVLNVTLFTMQYKQPELIDTIFIDEKTICGPKPLTKTIPYAQVNDHTIRILCPIDNTTASLFYRTKELSKHPAQKP